MIIAFHCIDSSRYFVGATAIRVSSLDFEGFLFWRVAFFSLVQHMHHPIRNVKKAKGNTKSAVTLFRLGIATDYSTT
jgi:hypothetical protein